MFNSEKNVSNEPMVLQAGLNCVVSDQRTVTVTGPPVSLTR